MQNDSPELRKIEKPLRIALVSDWCAPRRGGIEMHLISLAGALSLRGIESTIITSYPGEPNIGNIPIIRLPVNIMPFAKIAYSPFLRKILRDNLNAGGFDFVHIHPSIVAPVCLAAVAAAHDLNLPMLLTFHSKMTTLPYGLRLAERLTGWSRWGLAITAVSNSVARQLKSINPEKPVDILPNGFDHGFWCRCPEQRLMDENQPFRLVTTMRLRARKRPFALLKIFRRAAAILASGGIRLELVIAGDGPAKQQLIRAINRLGLSESCRITGWINRDELQNIYHKGHAFIMPSVKESFCISALEARASGLPVIARINTGIEDYIEHGFSGLLVDSDIAMAQAIVDLAGDHDRWRKIATAQTDLIANSWDKLAEKHETLYRALLPVEPIG